MAKQSVKGTTTPKTTSRITCYAPHAENIFLAGTFNDWNPTAFAMTKGGDAEWSAELSLIPGRYEYKFIVDGTWCCEPHLLRDGEPSGECVPNPFGTMNRVLIVR